MDQDLVKNLFDYKDGVLYWKKTGEKAGTRHHTGYTQINVKNKLYNAHRLIFILHYGYLPETVDHIDGDRANDSIENLRPATWSQNLQNMRIRGSNKSGSKNVSWDKEKRKWVVQLSINKKQTHIGRYDDLELADLVAAEARDKYHKSFARHS